MTLPAVFDAQPADVRDAVENIRERVRGLAESRLYQTAVALTVLSRTGGATRWPAWDVEPPSPASRFGKAELIGAMWRVFGTSSDALLRPGSTVGAQLGTPSKVMLDVFYGSNGPLTLVGNVKIDRTKNTAKLELNHGAWIWSQGSSSPAVPIREYNPVNTLNQQNGIGCAWPATAAVAAAPTDPASIYAVGRRLCPKRRVVAGAEPTCSLNDAVCGGQGDGAAREVTKPRLLAPPDTDSGAYLVLPGTVEALVRQATRGTHPLPAAKDLSVLVSWCATDGTGPQDSSHLLRLLGSDGVRLLTATS